jgi:hypothetical protein
MQKISKMLWLRICNHHMVSITLEQLVELARSSETVDPIDWGEYLIQEDTIYKTFALSVYNTYGKMAPQHKELLMLAAIVNLNVKLFLSHLHNKELLATIDRLQKHDNAGNNRSS